MREVIIATGALGFIGSNFVKRMNSLGKDVIGVDCYEDRNFKDLKMVDFIEKNDILDRIELIARSYSKVTVVHNGGDSNTKTPMSNAMLYNFEFTKNLMEVSSVLGWKTIYASSASVYGDGKNGFIEDSSKETPSCPYAFSKAMTDWHLMANTVKYPNVCSLRYFNVYGPGESYKGEMASPVHKFLSSGILGNGISLFKGSKLFFRDFIHVDNVIDVICHFMRDETSSSFPGVYNCGTGKSESFYDLAMIVKACLGSYGIIASVKEIQMPKELESQYQKFTLADVSKLRSAGFDKKFITLEEGIRQDLKNRLIGDYSPNRLFVGL